MPTSTVEDYLKCIYLEQERAPGLLVPTGQIAAGLQITPGTATAMVKTLADSGLVTHEPYAGVSLTPAGAQLAKRVLRRHRLVELFLVRVMGLNWSEVHSEAEVLEHAVSDRLIDRMDEMLGRPAKDPHGDPIPTARGEVPEPEILVGLLDCPVGTPVVLMRVIDQRKDFLLLLERHGLTPGKRLTVAGRDALAETVEVRPEEGGPLRLGFRAASTILVDGGIGPSTR